MRLFALEERTDMAIKVKASPEAVARAEKNGMWLAELTLDSTHSPAGGGGMRMTGAVSERIRKKLNAVMVEWIKEETHT